MKRTTVSPASGVETAVANVCLSRIHWTPGSKTLFYESNASKEDPLCSHHDGETLDVFERLLIQVPEPRKHNIHRFGIYSSKARAYRAKSNLNLSSVTTRALPQNKSSPPSPPKNAPR